MSNLRGRIRKGEIVTNRGIIPLFSWTNGGNTNKTHQPRQISNQARPEQKTLTRANNCTQTTESEKQAAAAAATAIANYWLHGHTSSERKQ
jgi:hypothetical protein